MKAIGELAGGVAHDFNNLLAAILGSTTLLKLGTHPEDRVFQAADLIQRAAERAARLTSQLLGFAKLGKHQNVPVDLHDAIHEIIAFLSRTLDKRIAIRQQLRAEQATAMGDPDQIQQLLLNLTINARDAMPDGGELRFETAVVEFDAEYCRWHMGATPGTYVMLAVSDTGHGIPREFQDRVFEPFFTTKEQGKGTGMGLAMVYGIVKNHGGTIRLYSEVGHGTTFKAYLPLIAADVPRAIGTGPVASLMGRGRILLVDDEPLVRESSTALLQQLGYEVVVAEDGRQAAAYYRDHSREIDLVILDLVMPRWGGRETFHALKAIDPSARVVISTGYGHNEVVQTLLDEGMAGFVPKPYHLRTLTEVLARVLGRKG
jgi:CheY-like chemotaxis protein